MKDVEDGKAPTGQVELGYLASDLSFVSRVLRAHIRSRNAEFYRENEVVSGSVALLSLIGLNPGISQNDLAAAVVLKKSAVTKIISEMQQADLVTREKTKSDRRFNALSLTDKGHSRWQRLQVEMSRQQDRLLAPLDDRERETLFALLGRLIAHYGGTAGDDDVARPSDPPDS
jgi:DNA-binding MarR family transcriptional regulator